jgi:hypothetical protein
MNAMSSLAELRKEKKRVICLLGLPGAGKSTVAGLLERICAAKRFHLPKVVGHLLPAEVREFNRRHAILFSGLEEAFLAQVDEDPASVLVLDGFLRSRERLRILNGIAQERNWSIEVVYLRTPGLHGLTRTILRQGVRDLREGIDPPRIYKKVRRDLPTLLSVLRDVEACGIPTYTIDALAPLDSVEKQVRMALGYLPNSLAWDRDVLRMLASVASDAWVTGGGHVYRPFFDNRFGPPSQSWDVDIRVWGEQRAFEIQCELQRRFPEQRWHVKDAHSWARKEIGVELQALEQSLAHLALICLCVGVRWHNDDVEIRWGNTEAEADLWNGILRPNPVGQVDFAPAKASKIASYYPAVYAPFIKHQAVPILRDYPKALEHIKASERGGRRLGNDMSQEERQYVERLIAFRNSLPHDPMPVPWPPPAQLPIRDPWFAKDAQFRIWVVNQVRSRTPIGGRDPYLKNALNLQTGGHQKVTHQGWSLHLHAFHALLEIETDHLPEFRRCMRVAMLWHDVGKLWNVHTPGAHNAIGASKWASMQGKSNPPLTPEEEQMISLFIRWHDLYGRLERGLWDEEYKGGISPSEVRKALTTDLVPFRTMAIIAKATWRADVGSVPLLRWLKPLADPLEHLIIEDFHSEPSDGALHGA